ncbi:MAG: hypothetical protein GKR98_14565 [Boseongicola sp.]|nr:MAG: hypothetical protein GKR98_14565 [Boseongicola sp.]
MTTGTATLLLTRPLAQSEEFLASCEGELGVRVPVVISPILRISDVGEIPNLESYQTIIVTSGNAVARLGREGILAGRNVACVGEKTAQAARDHGATARALGADVEAFIAASQSLEGRCLYLRGRHVSVDLVERLAEIGINCDEVAIYDQIAQPISKAASVILSGDVPIVAPIFSRRSAQLLAAHCQDRKGLSVLAVSDAVAKEWTGSGRVIVADEPTSEAMCAATIALL